jgi:hypothetical protein
MIVVQGHPVLDPSQFSSRLAAGKVPMSSTDLLSLISNPSTLGAFTDAIRTERETEFEKELEQQTPQTQTVAEMQAEDYVVARLRTLGNEAFDKQEWTTAYAAYEAGVRRTRGTDPVAKLNRAAAAFSASLVLESHATSDIAARCRLESCP